ACAADIAAGQRAHSDCAVIMKNLKLTIACGRYDRTQALIDGRVVPEGVDLTFIPLRPGETFWRMVNHEEFDCSEMSLSSYTILRSEGDTRFIAIPVFPSPPGNAEPGRELVPIGIPHLRAFQTGICYGNEQPVFDVPPESLRIL